MEFGEFKNTEAFNPTFKRVRELGLEQHAFELDSYGFTVVPPDKVADRTFFERIRETVLRVCKERTGIEFDLEQNGRRLKNQENYQWRVSQEMLDRNPPEFARLVAADDHMGWDEHGPDYARGLRYLSPEAKKRLQAMRSRRTEPKKASAA